MAEKKKNEHREAIEKRREQRRQKAVSAAILILAGDSAGDQWELSADKEAITLKLSAGPRVYSLARYKDTIETKVAELLEKKKVLAEAAAKVEEAVKEVEANTAEPSTEV